MIITICEYIFQYFPTLLLLLLFPLKYNYNANYFVKHIQ